jgi:hypothetical protein
MIAVVVAGILMGILLAYLDARRKAGFRNKLLHEFQSQMSDKAAERHIAALLRGKARWVKTFSLVRKPFSKEINLIIETAALLLASMALINSLINFDKNFASVVQGLATLSLLGLVVGFIPCEWLLSGKVDKEIDRVLNEVESALGSGDLKGYMARVERDLL